MNTNVAQVDGLPDHPDKDYPRRTLSVWKVAACLIVIATVIVVMPIVGFLGYIAVTNSTGTGNTARTQTSIQSMAIIRSSLLQYQLDHGEYPPTLAALTPKYLEETPIDAWKRPFVYAPTPSGANPFTLYSTGASGNDVIDYWKEKELLNK